MVPIRPAATLLLLRDGPDGPETWLMERSRGVAFMAAAWVFPGGRVDAEDEAAGAALGPLGAFRAAAIRELAEEAGVKLPLDAELTLWAHWITPEIEPRRYDTWFFATMLPEGQEAVVDGSEGVAGAWLRPVDALARYEAGTLALAPPTLRTLAELLPYSTVAEALAAPRRTPPICPRFAMEDADTAWVLLPGDPDFPSDEPVDPPTRFRFAVGRWWAR